MNLHFMANFSFNKIYQFRVSVSSQKIPSAFEIICIIFFLFTLDEIFINLAKEFPFSLSLSCKLQSDMYYQVT